MYKIVAILFASVLSISLHAQDVKPAKDSVQVEVVRDTVVDHSNDSIIVTSRGKVINIKSYAKRS